MNKDNQERTGSTAQATLGAPLSLYPPVEHVPGSCERCGHVEAHVATDWEEHAREQHTEYSVLPLCFDCTSCQVVAEDINENGAWWHHTGDKEA